MVIYVDGLSEPFRSYSLTALRAEGLPLPDSEWERIAYFFARTCGNAPCVWVVPAQPCPECATRRNLADNPGA